MSTDSDSRGATTGRWEIEFVGAPTLAHRFVSGLEQAGLEVKWDPPYEQRGGMDAVVHEVIIPMAVDGLFVVVLATAKQVMDRWPAVKITVKNSPGDDDEEKA